MCGLEQFARRAPGGFLVYRAGERDELLYANEVLLEMFGCASFAELLELTGGTFHGLVHPDDVAATEASIAAQIAEDVNQLDYVAYRIRRRDGSIRWVDDYGRLVHTEDEGDVFYVFLRDITDRLKTEMDLEREKRANEIKSSFLFNISHDIRTPMNAILGFTELALRYLDRPERARDYLEKVRESGQQLMALIDDVLEMSRLDYERLELKAEPCLLREKIGLTLNLFRGQAEEKRLTLIERLNLPEQEVLVDANRFCRVMANLISNAVKFTSPGGAVTVSAEQTLVSDSGYARYVFTVADTGAGMEPEFIKRMYEAFEREESSTSSGVTGTGLGLTITKRLLDVMGGSISVQSKKGEGSSFTVELPLKSAEHAAREPSPPRAQDTGKAAGERRLLLAEDIELNRMLAETILEEAGFLVESVPDGSDALEAVQNHPPHYYDLVLMDIQMPVMNGYEAARAIRALGREDTAALPIIALSANAREEDRRMSLESGMNSHVAKPFDTEKLVATINELIAGKGEDR